MPKTKLEKFIKQKSDISPILEFTKTCKKYGGHVQYSILGPDNNAIHLTCDIGNDKIQVIYERKWDGNLKLTNIEYNSQFFNIEHQIHKNLETPNIDEEKECDENIYMTKDKFAFTIETENNGELISTTEFTIEPSAKQNPSSPDQSDEIIRILTMLRAVLQ